MATKKKAASAAATRPRRAASVAAIKSLKNDVSLIGFGLLALAFMIVVILVIMLVSNNNAPVTNPPPAVTQTAPVLGGVQPKGVHSFSQPVVDPRCRYEQGRMQQKPAPNAIRVRNPDTGRCSWYVLD